MSTIIWGLLIGFLVLSNGMQTATGTLKTGIVTAGGDCAHKWWLQINTTKSKNSLVALEPEEKIPAELNNRKVQVEGASKICQGVEGGKQPVIVVEHIRPIEE